jgi:hypothetical protein
LLHTYCVQNHGACVFVKKQILRGKVHSLNSDVILQGMNKIKKVWSLLARQSHGQHSSVGVCGKRGMWWTDNTLWILASWVSVFEFLQLLFVRNTKNKVHMSSPHFFARTVIQYWNINCSFVKIKSILLRNIFGRC